MYMIWFLGTSESQNTSVMLLTTCLNRSTVSASVAAVALCCSASDRNLAVRSSTKSLNRRANAPALAASKPVATMTRNRADSFQTKIQMGRSEEHTSELQSL